MAGKEIRTCDDCVCWNAEAVCIRVMKYRFAGCNRKLTREQANRRPHYTPFCITRGGKMINEQWQRLKTM